MNNYDPIASHYDWLGRLIFRRNLIISQRCLLKHIPPRSSILIVGGGTGWILEEISLVHASGLFITYVELSGKMIQLAQKRDTKENQVVFVNMPIEEYTDGNQFSVILTAFLFDNFGPETTRRVFHHLRGMVSKDGKWLFADFHIDQKSSFWQKHLLRLMFLVFRSICNIEAKILTPVSPLFAENQFNEIYRYSRMSGFIQSSVFVKKCSD